MTKEPPEIPNVTPFQLRENMKERFAGKITGQIISHLTEPSKPPGFDKEIAEIENLLKSVKPPTLTPYGYLLTVINDPHADAERRMEAAYALLPYTARPVE